MASRKTQAQLAGEVGVSQGLISALERGHGTTTSIETWACVAAVLGEQLVGFLERAPGADLPRDIEHLRRQSALVELAAQGGWAALPELAIDPGPWRSRAIDVVLVRSHVREAAGVEIWDWLDDVGAAFRALDAKTALLARRLEVEASTGNLGPSDANPWRVRGLFVVRDTRRNRALLTQLRPLFAARFRGLSVQWLGALSHPTAPMPDEDGLLWSVSAGTGLRPSRLGRSATRP